MLFEDLFAAVSRKHFCREAGCSGSECSQRLVEAPPAVPVPEEPSRKRRKEAPVAKGLVSWSLSGLKSLRPQVLDVTRMAAFSTSGRLSGASKGRVSCRLHPARALGGHDGLRGGMCEGLARPLSALKNPGLQHPAANSASDQGSVQDTQLK